jgi:hypothetical protein
LTISLFFSLQKSNRCPKIFAPPMIFADERIDAATRKHFWEFQYPVEHPRVVRRRKTFNDATALTEAGAANAPTVAATRPGRPDEEATGEVALTDCERSGA